MAECPLLAVSGHWFVHRQCRLSEAKRARPFARTPL